MTDATLEKYGVGARVRLRHDVDRYPHFIARGGSLGTVAHNDGVVLGVRLDEHLPGAEEWDNEVIWSPSNDGLDPDFDIELVTTEGA